MSIKLIYMKMIILSMAFVTCSTVLFAQNQNRYNKDHRNPPQSVQQDWQNDHANDGQPTWQQSNGQWHAHYQAHDNNRNADTYYDSRGRQVDTHTQWDRKDVPQNFDQRVNQRYHANGKYDVTRIDRPNQKEVYELRVRQGNKNRTVYTDDQGNEVHYKDQHHH